MCEGGGAVRAFTQGRSHEAVSHLVIRGNVEVNKELMAADGSAVVGRRCTLSAPMAALMGTFAAARFSYVWLSL